MRVLLFGLLPILSAHAGPPTNPEEAEEVAKYISGTQAFVEATYDRIFAKFVDECKQGTTVYANTCDAAIDAMTEDEKNDRCKKWRCSREGACSVDGEMLEEHLSQDDCTNNRGSCSVDGHDNASDCEANGECSVSGLDQAACLDEGACTSDDGSDTSALTDQTACTGAGNTWTPSATWTGGKWTPAVWAAGPYTTRQDCEAAKGEWHEDGEKSRDDDPCCIDGELECGDFPDCCPVCLDENTPGYAQQCVNDGATKEGVAVCGSVGAGCGYCGVEFGGTWYKLHEDNAKDCADTNEGFCNKNGVVKGTHIEDDCKGSGRCSNSVEGANWEEEAAKCENLGWCKTSQHGGERGKTESECITAGICETFECANEAACTDEEKTPGHGDEEAGVAEGDCSAANQTWTVNTWTENEYVANEWLAAAWATVAGLTTREACEATSKCYNCVGMHADATDWIGSKEDCESQGTCTIDGTPYDDAKTEAECAGSCQLGDEEVQMGVAEDDCNSRAQCVNADGEGKGETEVHCTGECVGSDEGGHSQSVCASFGKCARPDAHVLPEQSEAACIAIGDCYKVDDDSLLESGVSKDTCMTNSGLTDAQIKFTPNTWTGPFTWSAYTWMKPTWTAPVWTSANAVEVADLDEDGCDEKKDNENPQKGRYWWDQPNRWDKGEAAPGPGMSASTECATEGTHVIDEYEGSLDPAVFEAQLQLSLDNGVAPTVDALIADVAANEDFWMLFNETCMQLSDAILTNPDGFNDGAGVKFTEGANFNCLYRPKNRGKVRITGAAGSNSIIVDPSNYAEADSMTVDGAGDLQVVGGQNDGDLVVSTTGRVYIGKLSNNGKVAMSNSQNVVVSNVINDGDIEMTGLEAAFVDVTNNAKVNISGGSMTFINVINTSEVVIDSSGAFNVYDVVNKDAGGSLVIKGGGTFVVNNMENTGTITVEAGTITATVSCPGNTGGTLVLAEGVNGTISIEEGCEGEMGTIPSGVTVTKTPATSTPVVESEDDAESSGDDESTPAPVAESSEETAACTEAENTEFSTMVENLASCDDLASWPACLLAVDQTEEARVAEEKESCGDSLGLPAWKTQYVVQESSDESSADSETDESTPAPVAESSDESSADSVTDESTPAPVAESSEEEPETRTVTGKAKVFTAEVTLSEMMDEAALEKAELEQAKAIEDDLGEGFIVVVTFELVENRRRTTEDGVTTYKYNMIITVVADPDYDGETTPVVDDVSTEAMAVTVAKTKEETTALKGAEVGDFAAEDVATHTVTVPVAATEAEEEKKGGKDTQPQDSDSEDSDASHSSRALPALLTAAVLAGLLMQ